MNDGPGQNGNPSMNDGPGTFDEARIRAAFADTTRRARMTPTPDSPAAQRPIWQQPGPLAAFAAVLLVVALGAAVLLRNGDDSTDVATEPSPTTSPSDSEPATTEAPVASTEAVTTTEPTTTTPAPTTTAGTDPTTPDIGGVRYKVDAVAVAADTADPFLNMRAGPDPGADLVAKLPPTYRGLETTGQTQETSDGAVWVEVQLVHPTPIVADLGFGVTPTGWVNAGFIVPLTGGVAVGVDEVPACSGSMAAPTSSDPAAPTHISYLESGEVEPNCVRVVLAVAAGTTAFEWPAVQDVPGVPSDAVVVQSGGLGTRIDLGGSVWSVWPAATDTADGVYVARADDGVLDLVVPRSSTVAGITTLPDEPGVLVVDLRVDDSPVPPAGNGVVLTQEPILGEGYVDIVGIARPFEANLGVTVETVDGDTMTAVFSGSSFLGTAERDDYGIDTTDWVEAWGEFALRAILPPGDYTVLLSADGGADEPNPLAVPVTITGEQTWGASEDAIALVDGVHVAAGADLLDDLPLADEVQLLLGDQVIRTAAADSLRTVDGWALDVEGFAGFSGPFNAIETLAREPQVAASSGPLDVCASPPRTWPGDIGALAQLNLVPIGIDSCIRWFGVSVFVDDQGDIAAVALDLFGP